MPDISKCANSLCPLRVFCYRYRVIPSKFAQCYADFRPTEGTTKIGKKVYHKTCDAFWQINEKNTKNLLPEDFVCGNIYGDRDV